MKSYQRDHITILRAIEKCNAGLVTQHNVKHEYLLLSESLDAGRKKTDETTFDNLKVCLTKDKGSDVQRLKATDVRYSKVLFNESTMGQLSSISGSMMR